MNFLVAGKGMFGVAIARYLAPHAEVTLVGPEASGGGSQAYGAHHDEGRIVADFGRRPLWSGLNRLAREGMTDLDPALIKPCGALTMTAGNGPDHLGAAVETGERHGSGVQALTLAEARMRFPMLRFDSDEAIVYQPAGGYFSPRRYVALATQAARAQGATVIAGTVRALRGSGTGVEAELSDGRRLSADTAIVATGAFAAGSSLLPVPVELRAKSEVYVMAELDDRQAADLHAMPCVNRTISYPQVADLYVLPPIRYPDGRTYLKFGANTVIDRWLPDPAAVRAWYHHGEDAGPLPALRAVLADLIPGIRVRSWHTRRCADAYTAHGHPYIGPLSPGVAAALGGNGRGAQAADAVGQLAAQIALTGEWRSGLPRAAFRPVTAPGPWHGMTLLRDHAP